MTLFYPDVSNNQWERGDGTMAGEQRLVAWLSHLKYDGLSGVVHKVSEGAGFRDRYWPACRKWCEENDLSWLGYHYVTTDDPDAQVRNFVANQGGPNVMIDFESGSGGIDNFWTLVDDFNLYGVNVSIAYIPCWYWSRKDIGSPYLPLADNRISLVSSAYPTGLQGGAKFLYGVAGGDGGEGWAPYGGATPTCWQFTDRAIIGGIQVDCNAYKGPGTNLDALFTGGVFG